MLSFGDDIFRVPFAHRSAMRSCIVQLSAVLVFTSKQCARNSKSGGGRFRPRNCKFSIPIQTQLFRSCLEHGLLWLKCLLSSMCAKFASSGLPLFEGVIEVSWTLGSFGKNCSVESKFDFASRSGPMSSM